MYLLNLLLHPLPVKGFVLSGNLARIQHSVTLGPWSPGRTSTPISFTFHIVMDTLAFDERSVPASPRSGLSLPRHPHAGRIHKRQAPPSRNLPSIPTYHNSNVSPILSSTASIPRALQSATNFAPSWAMSGNVL